MNQENSERLRDRFPQFYGEGNGFMKQGVLFECGDGWFNLLWKLSEDIETCLKKHPGAACKVVQVQEKFGQLRYYCSAPREVHRLVEDASRISEETCQECGRAAILRTIKGWIVPYCDSCYGNKCKETKPQSD